MSEGAQDLLVRGIAAAKAGDRGEARFYLNWLLTMEADLSQRIEAWYWLSEISDDPVEQRRYLEEILGNDPFNFRARRKLSILDGRLDPAQVVNPDNLPATPSLAHAPDDLQRFTCPKCGGRMTYTPDGSSLTCEYCERRQRASSASRPAGGEEDFLLALATRRGHTVTGPQPVEAPSLACPSCGASFWLSPEALSLTCPYCQSVYVVKRLETRRLVPPAGLIPMAVPLESACQAAKSHGVGTPVLQGVYFPAWSFCVGGQVSWTALRKQNRRWVPDAGLELVSQRDLLVAASPRLQAICPGEISGYDLRCLAPYDPSYLADWPAETYQISAAQASLVARQVTLQWMRRHIEQSFFESVRELTLDSSDLLVETFRLVLLPVWSARPQEEGNRFYLNGQTGNALPSP